MEEKKGMSKKSIIVLFAVLGLVIGALVGYLITRDAEAERVYRNNMDEYKRIVESNAPGSITVASHYMNIAENAIKPLRDKQVSRAALGSVLGLIAGAVLGMAYTTQSKGSNIGSDQNTSPPVQ